MLRINVVTIFPEFFEGPMAVSIVGRARTTGLVDYHVVDLRDFTHDKHRTVDDAPYGGGAGMVMKPEPFFEAVDSIGARAPIVLLSARGRPFRPEGGLRVFAAGGGAGMVRNPEPFFEAVDSIGARAPIVLLSARGRHFRHEDALRFSTGEELTLLC